MLDKAGTNFEVTKSRRAQCCRKLCDFVRFIVCASSKTSKFVHSIIACKFLDLHTNFWISTQIQNLRANFKSHPAPLSKHHLPIGQTAAWGHLTACFNLLYRSLNLVTFRSKALDLGIVPGEAPRVVQRRLSGSFQAYRPIPIRGCEYFQTFLGSPPTFATKCQSFVCVSYHLGPK